MPEVRKSRDGHARNPDKTKPAKIEPIVPPMAFSPQAAAEKACLWWLNGSSSYFAPMQSGKGWRSIQKADAMRLLRSIGCAARLSDGESLSQAERVIEHVQNFRAVDFAGPLAGYGAGVHYTEGGQPFIVTQGPQLIETNAGDCSLVRQIVEGRLNPGELLQAPLFYSWLRHAIAPLYAETRRKGPILFLVGPKGSGKSFLQSFIITPLLGGRAFDPTTYLKKEDGFNKGVMASEHNVIEEWDFPGDAAARIAIGEKLKKLMASDNQSYHPKGRDAVTMHPQLRISVSVNDNIEKLRKLPPFEDDFADKALLLFVAKVPMPMPTITEEDERALRNAVSAQLPAFAWWLLNEFESPPEFQRFDARFGTPTWQHPPTLAQMREVTREARFAHLLDKALDFEGWGPGSALALEEWLKDQSIHQDDFRKVLNFEGAAAQMLGILRKRELNDVFAGDETKHAEAGRYVSKHKNCGNQWTIRPRSEMSRSTSDNGNEHSASEGK